MNYSLLFNTLNTRQIRIAVTGASGGFGRSLLVQCRDIPSIEIAALCDLNAEGSLALLHDLNYCTNAVICGDAGEVKTAQKGGRTAIIRDYILLDELDLDMVIEATGKPEISIAIAINALQRGIHVGMVSKETDSVAGPWLNQLALNHDAVYTTVDGDQPSNLLGLITWAQVLGLEIVAAGKSSEYDFIWSPEENTVTWCDRTVAVNGLEEYWKLGNDIPASLARRKSLLNMLPLSATPDYCEMNVVANSAALTPACDELSYPLCHISELADIFVPQEDGGILARNGVVDVFNCLRRSDEVSFGGGVFIIVRCKDEATWKMLSGKGHVVGKNGKYACIYLPYHIMGLESPLSIFSAVLHHRSSGATDQQIHAVMAGHADRPLKKGESLEMGGHHHTIPDVSARLLPKSAGEGIAPYYLLSNKVLTRDIGQGELIPLDALQMDDSLLYSAWKETF
ncbi:homoserine dehydrogenase [Salmonella enterica]